MISPTACAARSTRLRVERDRVDLPDPFPLDLDAVLVGDAVGGGLHVREHVAQLLGLERALVERHLAALVDDRGDAGPGGDGADRGHAAALDRDFARREAEAGRGEEGVLAQVHRGRARVAGLAGEGDRVALDAEAADHGRGGLARLLQARALLDVQLQVGGDLRQLGLAHRVQVDVVLGSASGSAMPWLSLRCRTASGLERARGGGRAQQGAPEARALLVGPVDQLQRDLRRLALVRPQHLERREQAEAAVEPAAVGHRVDVRADDDDLVALARDRRPQVPGHVALHGGVGLLQLAEQPLPRRPPVLAPGQPAGPVRASRQLRQLLEVFERTFPVVGRAYAQLTSGARVLSVA